jgi:putative membrane protein
MLVGVIVLSVGALFAWLSEAFPAELPAWAPWEFSWVEYLGCVLALVWYVRGNLRLSAAERPGAWRQLSFFVGLALIYAVVQTKFTYLAQHSFTMTQIQQLTLHDVGPFLIALAWPLTSLEAGMPAFVRRWLHSGPVRGFFAVVQQPFVASVLFMALLVSQVAPPIVFRMMLDRQFFDAMNVVMALEGVLFWCLVLDPRPRAQAGVSYLTRVAMAFIVMLPVMPLGAWVAFSPQLLYDVYDLCGRLSWMDPLSDQSQGGLIFWVPAGMMSSIAVLLPLNAMRLSEERKERLAGRSVVQVGGRQIDPSAWTGR